MTKVVNVKVKYIRPEYENLKEWESDEDNVYIGRKGIVFIDGKRYPPQENLFHNPFKIGRDGDREKVLKKYEAYLRKKLSDDDFKEKFLELEGKILGCWCKPEKCHGDVIARMLENL